MEFRGNQVLLNRKERRVVGWRKKREINLDEVLFLANGDKQVTRWMLNRDFDKSKRDEKLEKIDLSIFQTRARIFNEIIDYCVTKEVANLDIELGLIALQAEFKK